MSLSYYISNNIRTEINHRAKNSNMDYVRYFSLREIIILFIITLDNLSQYKNDNVFYKKEYLRIKYSRSSTILVLPTNNGLR